ncbi:hypothetical protein ALO95_200431 [Pseudomonas syringae pv. antirrhini]|nr:hypothetical protein ALQ23_200365 [Pseudomonas syringae pv. antirrhini]RMW26014.1 hypothetical protein ALO95_200431 [Pseudomonas syringae pv. antirrhini]
MDDTKNIISLAISECYLAKLPSSLAILEKIIYNYQGISCVGYIHRRDM